MCLTPSFVSGIAGIGARPRALPPTRTLSPAAGHARGQRVVLRASARVSMLADTSSTRYGEGRSQGVHFDGSQTARVEVVRKQMEFWFSPSNLRRDWYLRRQMDEDGWLDPSVFLKFNRIKQLNVSLSELIDACRHSDVLEVSAPPDDGSSFGDTINQTRIRRSAEYPAFAEEESNPEAERSLVVEGISADATRESIRDIFLPYGAVIYTWVSKPSMKDPQIYAIVSFEDQTSAVAALDSFTASPPAECSSFSVKSKLLWDAMRARERNNSVVVELSGLSESVMWRDLWNEITEMLRPFDITVIYFLYKNGDPTCYITLLDESAGQRLMDEIFHEERSVVGCGISARILTEKSDLEKYWDKASIHMLERKKRQERHSKAEHGENQGPPRGVVISIDGLPAGTGWRRLMSELKTFGEVVFLNLPADSSKCFVRLKDAETASTVVDQLGEPNPSALVGAFVKAEVLEGEEEEEYWKHAAEERRRKRGDRKSLDDNSGTEAGLGGNRSSIGSHSRSSEELSSIQQTNQLG